MLRRFWAQLGALFWKNWIVLSKHPFLNIARCLILPIAFGAFLSIAQKFFLLPNTYGIGSPTSIAELRNEFDGSLMLVWADATEDERTPSFASQIMQQVTAGFSPSQLKAVKQVSSPAEITSMCPQNFHLVSECFAALVFDFLPFPLDDLLLPSSDVTYTIRADRGLRHIDVQKHTGDFEKRILPLQWAVDRAIIQLTTRVNVSTPLEWPFTQTTNEHVLLSQRLSYLRGIREIICLAFFLCYIGIAYQIPGAFSSERANGLTSHMKIVGLYDSARILSWHLSHSIVYLPAWIIVSLLWRHRIFVHTNIGLIVWVNLLTGASLASWSFFIAAPFGKSPPLAAVTSTFLAIVCAIVARVVSSKLHMAGTILYSLIFPPGFFIFAIRAISAFEVFEQAANTVRPDPLGGTRLFPLIIVAIINIFLWPCLAVLLERALYDPRYPSKRSNPWWRRSSEHTSQEAAPIPSDVAISIRHLEKRYPASTFLPWKDGFTAVADLTLDIPKFGIFVLLGSNGAGKSTVLSVIAGILGHTRGSVTFSGGSSRPPPGTLGVVPQKNVLFPELSCIQTLRVWSAVKRSSNSPPPEDLEQLLRDCDLGRKIHHQADTLSGGQKRKLQLAIGLVGGSKLILIDECTSGVDPLSRRALWKTLTAFRNERTIVFTTHFLDEADLLADQIAVLVAPGRLVALGSPVSLKATLGEGYTIQTMLHAGEAEKDTPFSTLALLQRVRTVAPEAFVTSSSLHQVSYHLKVKDSATVEKVLQLLDSEGKQFGISSYEILGTSIEEIFLRLMKEEDSEEGSALGTEEAGVLQLTDGRRRSPFGQSLTIFHKRLLIARRSWLALVMAVLLAVVGSVVPLFFLKGRQDTCITPFDDFDLSSVSLFLPHSPYSLFGADPSLALLTSPPGLVSALDLEGLRGSVRVQSIMDNATFIQTVQNEYRNLPLGGISMDLQTQNALIAWEASRPGTAGPTLLNLATNLLYNQALNSSSGIPGVIRANYSPFPFIDAIILVALKWTTFFGLAMAVFPAFFALYVSRERRSLVQAMQLSNGLSNPVGLWLGHLLFDSMFILIVATVNVIAFATYSDQFHGLGFFWFILVLYGMVGALFAYCASLLFKSPLAAFAAVAGYQAVMFILYIMSYLFVLTYAKQSQASRIFTITHFSISWLSPVSSLLRASFVSVNIFSLLCNGTQRVGTASLGQITRYGGPILYLLLTGAVLFAILVLVDSGPRLPSVSHRLAAWWGPTGGQDMTNPIPEDVLAEVEAVSNSNDPLRVVHVSKSFGRTKVLDDINFGVPKNTVFAMLGPNGAGKTTAFNIIRGMYSPDHGDVFINGVSVVHRPRIASVALGVCPQFSAIDSQLTVRQHLMIYGGLKGLGAELHTNVTSLLRATSLHIYADRLASKLSNGNQRKLALAIALIGNPAVILIDEYSTGIDARMKREMWDMLRNVAVGKSVVMTTHSMEEASALSNKVCIIAKRLLAVGPPDALSARYSTYEVQFACRSREDVLRAQQLMALIPGARMADDVATRFEVPVGEEKGLSLAQLFHLLATQGDFAEYTVERGTLESVFLKVIRENNVVEENDEEQTVSKWCF